MLQALRNLLLCGGKIYNEEHDGAGGQHRGENDQPQRVLHDNSSSSSVRGSAIRRRSTLYAEAISWTSAFDHSAALAMTAPESLPTWLRSTKSRSWLFR